MGFKHASRSKRRQVIIEQEILDSDESLNGMIAERDLNTASLEQENAELAEETLWLACQMEMEQRKHAQKLADAEQRLLAQHRKHALKAQAQLDTQHKKLVVHKEVDDELHVGEVQAERDTNAYRSIAVSFLSVIVMVLALTVLVRATGKVVAQTLDTDPESLMNPRLFKASIWLAIAGGMVVVIGRLTTAYSVHSNNARSMTEKMMEMGLDIPPQEQGVKWS